MTVASQALTGPGQGPWDKHDGRYTLRVLGFIENRLGNALMQTLILWFWRPCGRRSRRPLALRVRALPHCIQQAKTNFVLVAMRLLSQKTTQQLRFFSKDSAN